MIDERVDKYMPPVRAAIERHVKNRDAVTDIYNRAYEAIINSMDEKDASLRAENERLRGALRRLYEPAKVAVNQIVCMGGEDVCQPCENREKLAETLYEVEAILGKDGE